MKGNMKYDETNAENEENVEGSGRVNGNGI